MTEEKSRHDASGEAQVPSGQGQAVEVDYDNYEPGDEGDEASDLYSYTFTPISPEPGGTISIVTRAPSLEEARNVTDFGGAPFTHFRVGYEPGCPELVAVEESRQAQLAEVRSSQREAIRAAVEAAGADPGSLTDEVADAIVNMGLDALEEHGFPAGFDGLPPDAERYAGEGFPGGSPGPGMRVGAESGEGVQFEEFGGPSPFEQFSLGGGGVGNPLLFGYGEGLYGSTPFQSQRAPIGGALARGQTHERIELFRKVVCGGFLWLGERLRLLPDEVPQAFVGGGLSGQALQYAQQAWQDAQEDWSEVSPVVGKENPPAPESRMEGF